VTALMVRPVRLLGLVVAFALGCGNSAFSDGPFRFTNITGSSRFFSLRNGGGHGVQAADATGDGRIDLYVTNIFAPRQNRPDLFFVNMGGATFRERSVQAGIADDGFFGLLSEESHSAVFFDADNDGDYDLFNVHTWTGNHRIYRNDGAGNFQDASRDSGIQVDAAEARGAAAGDLDGDGWTDIVLTGWENQPMQIYFGRGGFRFERRSLGRLGSKLSNQGVMLADVDGDGDLDIAATGHALTNVPIGSIALLANDGNGNFRNMTASSGIRFGDEGTNGWSFGDLDGDADLDAVIVGPSRTRIYLNDGAGGFTFRQLINRGNFTGALADFDHDGDLDLYIGGTEVIYGNNGDARFERFDGVGIGGIGNDPRGVAVADFDGDGDMDFALVSKRGANTLFRNDLDDPNWLKVRLVGPRGDAGAIGTKVYVYDERHVDQRQYLVGFREARSATGYCSQDSPVLHFGVPGNRVYEVKAVFPDGRFHVAKGVEAPAEIVIDPGKPLR